MKNVILLDIKTSFFELKDTLGIHELAVLAIENGKKKETLHLSIIKNKEESTFGYGFGYEDLSHNNNLKDQFKKFIENYKYPLITHNASLHKNLLLYYNWIDEQYPFYDSKKTIKYHEPNLSSYSMENIIKLLDLKSKQQNTAIKTVELLYEIIRKFNINKWIPLKLENYNSTNTKENNNPHKNMLLNVVKKDLDYATNILNDKNIAFTGEGPLVRDKLIDLAKKHGALIASNSVTKKTNLLIVGKKPGKKLIKASKLGIEIMDVNDFFTLISDTSIPFHSKEILDDTDKNQLTFFSMID